MLTEDFAGILGIFKTLFVFDELEDYENGAIGRGSYLLRDGEVGLILPGRVAHGSPPNETYLCWIPVLMEYGAKRWILVDVGATVEELFVYWLPKH